MWRRHAVDAAFAALIAAAVMAIAIRATELTGLNLGVAVLFGPALAGAVTAYLAPRVRALEVWIGQTALGAAVAVALAVRDHASAGGVLVGFAIIAVLGMGSAAAVHAARPAHRRTRLPSARVHHH
jgi:hypothetical protein